MGHIQCGIDIPRENREAQTIDGVVGEFHGLVDSVEYVERGHRAKGFIPTNFHGFSDAGEHGGLAAIAIPFAAGKNLNTLCFLRPRYAGAPVRVVAR